MLITGNLTLMERLIHNLIVVWLIGSAVHAPFPIWNGSVHYSTSPDAAVPGTFHHTHDFLNLEFVFLGCDLPDLPGDGPIDSDPEQGIGPFGALPAICTDRSEPSDCRMDRTSPPSSAANVSAGHLAAGRLHVDGHRTPHLAQDPVICSAGRMVVIRC